MSTTTVPAKNLTVGQTVVFEGVTCEVLQAVHDVPLNIVDLVLSNDLGMVQPSGDDLITVVNV